MNKQKSFSQQQLDDFIEVVQSFYKLHKRSMPWRTNTNPYWVLVSEFMLQQTQVERVIPKFNAFIQRFPSYEILAQSELSQVLEMWQGLGYNRRAKYVWQTAQQICSTYNGKIPADVKLLQTCPGIGQNTAAAIISYSYNIPTTFIETNIRRVFLHHFFADQKEVSDAQIIELVTKTVDVKNPRQWYWALMDYSVHLKKTYKSNNHTSKHYVKQSKFEGSNRQVRAQIIRILLQESKPLLLKNIQAHFPADEKRVMQNCTKLASESLIKTDGDNRYWI